MATIATTFKKQLSLLLGQGHRHFGKVDPRKPYREDDDDGGVGTSELRFETHPLLSEQPVGAASELTDIMTEYTQEEALDALKEREEQASPQLRKQPALQEAAKPSYTPISTPKPF